MRNVWRCDFMGYLGVAMQDLGYELPRIPILGRWVNKGNEAGPELLRPGPALLLSPHPRSRSSSENSLTSAMILSPRVPLLRTAAAAPMPRSARLCRACCNG